MQNNNTVKYIQSPLPHLFTHERTTVLQTHTPIRAILQKHAPIDLPLVQPALLVPAVDDIGRARRLLEDADLELAATRQIGRRWAGNELERGVADGVVGCELAVLFFGFC